MGWLKQAFFKWRERAAAAYQVQQAKLLHSADFQQARSTARGYVGWAKLEPAELEALLRVSLRERELNPRRYQLLRRKEKWLPTRGPIFFDEPYSSLRPALQHPDPAIRAEALRAIDELEDWTEEGSAALADAEISALLNDPDPTVREVATEVLADMGWPLMQVALPLLAARLDDPEVVVRFEAVRQLSYALHQVPEVRQWLEPLRQDPDLELRSIVCDYLAELDGA